MIPQANYLSEQTVINALRSQLGNVALAAAELSISRGQLMDYIQHHPDVRAEQLQIKESILDEAEVLLIQKMKTDNTLLMFYLRTQGKRRGYTSDTTISGPGGGPIEVNLNARALIAAMRNGFEDDSKEESTEESDLLDESGSDSGGVRGGGTWEVLPQSRVLHT